jgi:two-component system, NtrC family, nitrogen regulation sensor histidine kinase NtrY
MTLRTRLLLLISAIVASVVILVTWTVSSSARRAFATVEAQRTAALVGQFRREFAAEGERVMARVERIAASDAIARMAGDILRSSRDYGPYVNEAAVLAAAYDVELLDLVASDGTIVSSAHWPARFGYRHAWISEGAPAVNQRTAFLHAVELPRGVELGLFGVRTLGAGGRSLFVVGGRRLNQDFLKTLALPPGMRVLLYRNVEPELARQQLIDASGEVTDAAPLDPLIARIRQSGREASETVQWPDDPETVEGIPLTGFDGTTLGVLLVASSGRELASLVSRIRWSGFGFAVLGIGVGTLVSYIVASRVTRPVEQLAGAARSVASGDWDVHLDDVAATGEIEELAQAFTSMTNQLVEQRERLLQAERVAAWRELARRLAHELKNPLFPLRITVDNLRRARALSQSEFDEVLDESLTTLGTGLANLNTVITRFSDFSRMPAPHFAPVSVNDVVRESVGLFRAQLDMPRRPSVNVVVDLEESPGAVQADAEQLGRAVQNLLLNAIDAMPGGGDLTVRTRGGPTAIRIDVSDTGGGLTDEERRRLFTPYYTTKHHGTGLGLAIVQSVVADHHGRIWVESEHGRGTTFHVEIPRETQS